MLKVRRTFPFGGLPAQKPLAPSENALRKGRMIFFSLSKI
jgi:hypothetical protein